MYVVQFAVNISVLTLSKLGSVCGGGVGRRLHKGTQTDEVEPTSTPSSVPSKCDSSCNCETKYNKMLADLKDQKERDHAKEKEKALRELEERVSDLVLCCKLIDEIIKYGASR